MILKKLNATTAVSAGLFALCSASPALSQSLPGLGQSDTGWRNAGALYMFAPLSATGTSTVAGQEADVDLDLQDILDLLEFAIAGRYEAWNGDWGVIVDANYTSLAVDSSLPGPLGSDVEVDVKQKWLGLLAGYRVAHGTYGANNQSYAFDIQGGVRYNSLKQTVDIETPGPGQPPTLGGDEDWFEPVVGARGMWRLNDRWTTILSADFGGFGYGGNDLQIGANIGFDYQPWEKTAITFGYRYFSMDYSKDLSDGEFAYDVVQHGPYIGIKYFFN